MKYLGDYADNQTIRILWSTNNSGGGSTSRSTSGTIVVEDMQALTGPINTAVVAGAVVTVSDVAHGLVTGDDVITYGVSTLTQINQKAFTITVVDANSFTLNSFDATGLTSGSGGTWKQINIADVTDTENLNGIVGLHKVEIDTSADDYFVTGRDYCINIINCVVDSQPVDTTIAQFSIENRDHGTTIVGPVQTVTSPGNFVGSPTTLQIFQKESRVVSFSVVDGSGTVVNLSGKTLRFMVITDSNTPTAVFKVDSGNITISGSSNEVVTVSISSTLSDIAVADHVWRLWDVNNSDVYAHGPFQILPALADTA